MNKQDIFRLLAQNIREVMPALAEVEFSTNDSLSKLGANSIDRVEIIMMTMESLALNVPLISFAKVKNIDGLLNILHDNFKEN